MFVPLGSLVVVDECPFYWGADRMVPPNHLAFFREHRHIVSEDGTACDLVLVSQTVDAVHRSLRGLVEFSVDCKRLAALGLNRKYTAVTYEGSRRSGKYVTGRQTRTYDKRIFPLYRSFSQANGKILQTDSRRSIWRASRWFWLVFAVCPILFGGSVYMLYHQFYRSAAVGASNPIAGVHPDPVHAAVASAVTPAGAAAKVAPVRPRTDIGGETSGPVSVWHVLGSVTFQSRPYAIIGRAGFPLRYMPLSNCALSFGRPVTCHVGDEVFEPSSGPSSAPAAASGAVWGPDAVAARSVH